MATSYAKFGRFVRAARVRLGLTQEQVADRSGLSADTVRRVERCKIAPSFDTLVRISGGLGVSLGALFSSFERGSLCEDAEIESLVHKLSHGEKAASIRVLRTLISAMEGTE